MTGQALEKLWRKSRGRIPHLDAVQYNSLVPLCARFTRSGAKFWGVVDEKRRHAGSAVVHCFNFGNTSVKFPWHAEAVNFGHRIPMTIVQSGTVRTPKTYRTLLHQIESPFLVFGFEGASFAEEQLASGYVITETDSAELITEREVVMLPGYPLPDEGGLLFYFLTKRIPFSAQPLADYSLRGVDTPLRRFRLQLREPMLLEPGWALLMLEKDRWTWGVVTG